jgi:hypothetical protein
MNRNNIGLRLYCILNDYYNISIINFKVKHLLVIAKGFLFKFAK